MKNYPKHIKNTLFSVIHEMAKHPEGFSRCPGKDFTRDRKLPFEQLLTLFVKMGGHSLRDEMLDCLDIKGLPASVSAFVQQRSKLLPEALEYLFHTFTDRCQKPKLYNLTETLITNLDKDTFPVEELKHLYHLRWGIETSFRQRKYTIDLSLFQSKKVEYITQEIFARLTMYNFCELITSHVVIQKKRRKYGYQTNFTAAVHICRQFLRGGIAPPKVADLISNNLVPIRPGRSTPRKAKNIKFNGFFYRVA